MITRWWSALYDVVKELFLGILALGLLFQASLVFLFEDKVSYSLGLWMGISMALFMAWHISHTLDGAMGMMEKDAGNHIRKGYGVRFLLLVLLVLAIYYFRVGNVIAFFLGVMTLKFSAYLQPVIHKLRSRR